MPAIGGGVEGSVVGAVPVLVIAAGFTITPGSAIGTKNHASRFRVAGSYAAIVTWVLVLVLDALLGLRVPEDAEREGLDVSLHGEEAYHAAPGSAVRTSLE